MRINITPTSSYIISIYYNTKATLLSGSDLREREEGDQDQESTSISRYSPATPLRIRAAAAPLTDGAVSGVR